MSLRIEPFAGAEREWDEFGGRQAGWTAFHRVAWRDVIAQVFGHECHFLCARGADGSLSGILPLVRVRSRLFGHYLVSLPFVSYGGPLGTDDAIVALCAAANDLCARSGADLLELRATRPLPVDWPVSHRKITVVMPLVAGDPEATFKSIKSKVRSQVRRPAKEGVVIRLGSDQAGPFHEVFARHMRDLGTPSMPRRWFTDLAAAFGDDMWFATAWLRGKPIAGGAGFRWPGEFEITWASSLREHQSIAANMGVYGALIEEASRQGLGRFNFGRCTPGGATHRFKQQWGALDEPLYWYRGPASRTQDTPRPDSSGFALATRMWQRLPLPIANVLGPRLVRYIP